MTIFTHVWSYDMRHTGFPQVDGSQRDPRDLGHHICNFCLCFAKSLIKS